MTTVFLAGSRTLSHLTETITDRLSNILGQQFRIVIGDANGADKALQKYLYESHYSRVVIYCAGQICRNNLGNWPTMNVSVDSRLTGREFYIEKDKKMADDSDYGFMLWDGKSPGTMNNILELLKRQKKALVYVAPECTFYTVATVSDARQLLSKCDEKAAAEIERKIDLKKSIKEIEGSAQHSLRL